MTAMLARLMVVLLTCSFAFGSVVRKKKESPVSPTSLQQFIQRVRGEPVPVLHSLGSLWPLEGSQFTDLATDYKARNLNDIVVIRIVEQTLAQASGNVTGQRTFNSSSAITGILGQASTLSVNPLYNLNSASNLKGTGTANSQSLLQSNLAGRVAAVLPNGYLVVEGAKDIQVNSERQTVSVRGIVRPTDLATSNVVSSSNVADLEVRINGKGVVNDSVRRPNFLYRLLLGLMPF